MIHTGNWPEAGVDLGGKTVAVIGPLADDKASQLGPWAGNGQAKDAVTPLEGVVAEIGKEHVL